MTTLRADIAEETFEGICSRQIVVIAKAFKKLLRVLAQAFGIYLIFVLTPQAVKPGFSEHTGAVPCAGILDCLDCLQAACTLGSFSCDHGQYLDVDGGGELGSGHATLADPVGKDAQEKPDQKPEQPESESIDHRIGDETDDGIDHGDIPLSTEWLIFFILFLLGYGAGGLFTRKKPEREWDWNSTEH